MIDEKNTQQTSHLSPFEAMRHYGEGYGDYWSAREMYKLLGYSRWEKFKETIDRAKDACEESGHAVADHFHLEVQLITAGKGAKRKVEDIYLTRYACYLTLQNADPSGKPVVALAQTYFAVQTRRQELADEQVQLSEDQLRLLRRSQMSLYNTQLAQVAQGAGGIASRDFAIFQDHGYTGLYGGLKAKDIHVRKELKKSQDILDYMGSDELAANIFRASLTKQKIEREQIDNKQNANQAHHEMGKAVRKTILETGATAPEDLPTPDRGIQQVQREEQKRIERQRQPVLFAEAIDEEEHA